MRGASPSPRSVRVGWRRYSRSGRQSKERGERKGPFNGAWLAGADVFWLAAWALAAQGDEQAVVAQVGRLRAPGWVPMSALHLEGAHLQLAFLGSATTLTDVAL